jgi:Protein of unknown function (DUF2798)
LAAEDELKFAPEPTMKTKEPKTQSPSQRPSQTLFGLPKLPARYAGIVMPLFLSIFMTCIVSGISTLRSVGPVPGVVALWLSAWALSWLVSFPTMLLVLPLVRKATAAVVRAGP